jgi:lupus La protein
MRRFEPYTAVVAALRDSSVLNLSGDEGEEVITRKDAYQPSHRRRKTDEATIYAKGFGDETASTQFDLEAFFTQFGAVSAVRLRRTPEKFFKGSVFVEFQEAESAKKFLALEPKPQWKGHDLKIMSKTDYVQEKTALINEGKIEPSKSKRKFFEGKDDNGRGGHRGKFDKDDWKKRRDDDQKSGFRGGRGGRGRGGRGRGGRGGRGGRYNDRHGDRNDKATAPVEHKEPRHAYVPIVEYCQKTSADILYIEPSLESTYLSLWQPRKAPRTL